MSAEADEEGRQDVLLGSRRSSTTISTSTARSERKRQRERTRRSALSNAFDELASFVIRMDPEPGDEDHERTASRKKRAKKPNENEQNYHGISQVDIVGRSLKFLKRLHNENEEHKRILNTMQFRDKQHVSMDDRTFSPSGSAWHRTDESTYPNAYRAAHDPTSSYSHSFSRYDYHAAATSYDPQDYYGPSCRRGNDHDNQYWTNDGGNGHHGVHNHHPF